MIVLSRLPLVFVLIGMALFGAALWSAWGWETAIGFWGACLMTAGIAEVLKP